MRAVKLQSLKNFRLGFNVALKAVVVSTLVLIVVILVLIAPWYPMTTSQVVLQTQSFTTQFETPTTNYQTVTVYTLSGPVKLQSVNYGPPEPSDSCALSWIYCNLAGEFESGRFNLQAEDTYTVTVSECQECSLAIAYGQEIAFGEENTQVSIHGSGQTSFVVPNSGAYLVTVGNYGEWNSTGVLNAISITGSVPQSVQVTRTLTTYSTTSVTEYSQIIVSPYTVLGVTVSATAIALLALIAIMFDLFERQKRQPT